MGGGRLGRTIEPRLGGVEGQTKRDSDGPGGGRPGQRDSDLAGVGRTCELGGRGPARACGEVQVEGLAGPSRASGD